MAPRAAAAANTKRKRIFEADDEPQPTAKRSKASQNANVSGPAPWRSERIARLTTSNEQATTAKATAAKANKSNNRASAAKSSKAAQKTTVSGPVLRKSERIVRLTAAKKMTTTTAKTTATKAATKTAPKPASKPTTKAATKAAAEMTTKTATKTTAKTALKTAPKPARKKAPPKPKLVKPKVVLTSAPNQKLDVYAFGSNSMGDLGMGASSRATEVLRPRYNPKLAADQVGVVHISTGAAHSAALTHDNKILTWGVNDEGALGRLTEAKLLPPWPKRDRKDDEDSDAEDDSDGEDTGLSPYESNPIAIQADKFPPDTVFTQLAAGDNSTFALTDDGHVYGWGIFRNGKGNFGFHDVNGKTRGKKQEEPMLIPGLKDIVQISAGSNHVLALDKAGNVFAWGSSDQGQTGRRPIERHKFHTLTPTLVALPKRNKIASVSAGKDHSFALEKNGTVWAWGLNSHGQTGIKRNAGESAACITKPEKITALPSPVKMIVGGSNFSIAVTENGDTFGWGAATDGQLGLKPLPEDPEHVLWTESGKQVMVIHPTKIPNLPPVKWAAAGERTTMVIDEEGQPWSWGLNGEAQAGQGNADMVEVPMKMKSKDIQGKKMSWAGQGAGFGLLAADHMDID